MARDEDDDLYDEEFDFVDEDDDEDGEEDSAVEETAAEDEEGSLDEQSSENGEDSREDVDEYGRPKPQANYVVHIYEQKKLTRTIDRPFTPEDAEAFATEYNRTAKPYHRVAVPGKNETQPKKTLD